MELSGDCSGPYVCPIVFQSIGHGIIPDTTRVYDPPCLHSPEHYTQVWFHLMSLPALPQICMPRTSFISSLSFFLLPLPPLANPTGVHPHNPQESRATAAF